MQMATALKMTRCSGPGAATGGASGAAGMGAARLITTEMALPMLM